MLVMIMSPIQNLLHPLVFNVLLKVTELVPQAQILYSMDVSSLQLIHLINVAIHLPPRFGMITHSKCSIMTLDVS